LLWLGNFKTSGCLVGRPTCAPATTRLTLQLVGTSTITYNHQSRNFDSICNFDSTFVPDSLQSLHNFKSITTYCNIPNANLLRYYVVM